MQKSFLSFFSSSFAKNGWMQQGENVNAPQTAIFPPQLHPSLYAHTEQTMLLPMLCWCSLWFSHWVYSFKHELCCYGENFTIFPRTSSRVIAFGRCDELARAIERLKIPENVFVFFPVVVEIRSCCLCFFFAAPPELPLKCNFEMFILTDSLRAGNAKSGRFTSSNLNLQSAGVWSGFKFFFASATMKLLKSRICHSKSVSNYTIYRSSLYTTKSSGRSDKIQISDSKTPAAAKCSVDAENLLS